ncbi:hypothetical protein GCM10009544_20650 [Streptomyces stramineus]|uniref:Uncharacterized protein n=1 Tax=Streptomyces stramineus TaxID=173861 RepID=A0ABN0ZSY8_9ACTN
MRATVLTPEGAPLPEVAATRGRRAGVLLRGRLGGETLRAVREYARRTGADFLSLRPRRPRPGLR